MSSRNTFEADFEFSWQLLTAFFAQRRIRRALDEIAAKHISGWEKWWQVELALFLSEHDEIGSWNMEEEFLTDRRLTKKKDFVAADIAFRKKGHAQDRLTILELKQDLDWKRCLANMMKDAEKIDATHARSLSDAEIRSFFVVGVYPSQPKAAVHDYIESLAERRGVEWDIMDTRFIADTPYSFTIL